MRNIFGHMNNEPNKPPQNPEPPPGARLIVTTTTTAQIVGAHYNLRPSGDRWYISVNHNAGWGGSMDHLSVLKDVAVIDELILLLQEAKRIATIPPTRIERSLP
jgi:hypothetical protein